MLKIPSMKAKRLIRILKKSGFFIYHQTGSHVQMHHLTNNALRVTIPRHDRFDLPQSILHSILNQAELTREKFLNLLKKN